MEDTSRKNIIDSIAREYTAIFGLDVPTASKVISELSLLSEEKLIMEGLNVKNYYDSLLFVSQQAQIDIIRSREGEEQVSADTTLLSFI